MLHRNGTGRSDLTMHANLLDLIPIPAHPSTTQSPAKSRAHLLFWNPVLDPSFRSTLHYLITRQDLNRRQMTGGNTVGNEGNPFVHVMARGPGLHNECLAKNQRDPLSWMTPLTIVDRNAEHLIHSLGFQLIEMLNVTG